MSDSATSPNVDEGRTVRVRIPRLTAGSVGLVLAVVLALALTIVYINLSGQLDERAAALETLQEQTAANTAALKATTATDLSKVTAGIAAQGKRIGLLEECLPELQGQVNGLNVTTAWTSYGDSSVLTSAYLTNNTLTSRTCKPVLLGGE